MGEPAKRLPDPEMWGDAEIEHNTRLLEEYDSGRKQFTGDPEVLETVRLGLQWRADQQAGDADALELPFSTWRAANMPALPADAPLHPGEEPADAPMARPATAPAAPAQPQQAPATPAREPSIWEQVITGGNRAIKAADAAAGSFMRTDLTDKIGAWVADQIPVPGINKDENRYAEGNSYQSLAQGTQRDMRQAEAEFPWATAAGDAAQITGGAMLGGPQVAATTLPGRMAAGAAEGAALGAAQRMGSADPAASDAELLEEFATGGAAGGAVGALAPAAMSAVGAAAKPVAERAGKFASRMRAAAPGGYGAQLKRLANREGLEYTDETLGREIERLIPPKRFGIPRSPRDYADEALPKLEAARKASGQAIDEATEAGATAPFRAGRDPRMHPSDREVGVLDTLSPIRREAHADPAISGAQYAKQLDKQIALIRAKYAGKERLTPRELQDMKLKLEDGGWKDDPTASLSDAASSRAMREASKGPRGALDYAMRSQAPEETYERWLAAKRDIGPLEEIESMARGRAAQESGNQLMSLPTSIAFAGGGALGGAGIAGAEGGLIGAGAGLASLGGTELVKRYGRDALANAGRGVERNLGLLARTAPEVGAAAVPVAASASAGRAGSARLVDEAFGVTPALAEGEDQAQQQPAPRTQAEAGEHPYAATIRRAMQSFPRALGKWGPELQKAEQEGGAALGATLMRLQKDPEFVREVLPLLAERAGQQGAM